MLEPAKHDDVSLADQPGLLAPDTSGMNFYRADPALTDLIRGDARRLLLSRMVIDQRLQANNPFRLTENPAQRAITGHLLGERAMGLAEVGELLAVA
jgi:hypothetical protein